jgi:hypothetical protein
MIGRAFRRSCKLSVISPKNDWHFLRSLPAKKRELNMSNMEMISMRVRDAITKDPICCYPNDIGLFMMHLAFPRVRTSQKPRDTRA